MTFGESKRWPWPPVGSAITEADVCIYGGSAGPTALACTGNWRVRSDNVPNIDKDLIGLLVHETGHALGLGHLGTDDGYSVMTSDAFGCGNTFARFPYGDDIDGMRALYGYGAGGIPAAYWRNLAFTWGPETAVPALDGVWPLSAAIGKSGTGQKVVVGELSDAGDVIAFNQTAYPPSANPTWSAPSVVVDTWRAPSITARPVSSPLGEKWVAAVAKKNQFASDCSRLRLYSSSDTFTNSSFIDLPGSSGCGSMHEPAVAYIGGITQRFVAFYVRREAVGSSQSQLNGRIYATTSPDGVNWLIAKDLGFYTIDGVGIACQDSLFGSCSVTYVRGSSNDPKIVNRSFTIAVSDGSVNLSPAYTLSSVYAERTPAIAVYSPFFLNTWLIASPSAANETDRGNSAYTLGTGVSAFNPFPNDFSFTAVTAADRRGSLAAVYADWTATLWYVR